MKYKFTHLGKNKSTIFYRQLTPEFCNSVRADFYKEISDQQVDDNLRAIAQGKTSISNIYHRYFYRLMTHCRKNDNSWSIHEFIQSDELLSMMAGFMDAHPKLFLTDNFVLNLRSIFRIANLGANSLSNFPFAQCKDILRKYNTNNVYYDYSCGWGSRLLASLTEDIEYHGTDPNTILCDSLNEIGTKYHLVNPNIFGPSQFKIYNHGSEIDIPVLHNKVGLAFSSPPYFDLELYSNCPGDSIILNSTYEMWLENYWRKTVYNIKNYLTSNGYFILNIKNIQKYNLAEDMNKIIDEAEFIFIESFTLKNITSPSLLINTAYTNDELCYVYRKKL